MDDSTNKVFGVTKTETGLFMTHMARMSDAPKEDKCWKCKACEKWNLNKYDSCAGCWCYKESTVDNSDSEMPVLDEEKDDKR